MDSPVVGEHGLVTVGIGVKTKVVGGLRRRTCARFEVEGN